MIKDVMTNFSYILDKLLTHIRIYFLKIENFGKDNKATIYRENYKLNKNEENKNDMKKTKKWYSVVNKVNINIFLIGLFAITLSYFSVVHYNINLHDVINVLFGPFTFLVVLCTISLIIAIMSIDEFLKFQKHRILNIIYLNTCIVYNVGFRFELLFLAFVNFIWFSIELWAKVLEDK